MKFSHLYHNEKIVALANFFGKFWNECCIFQSSLCIEFFFFGWLSYCHFCNNFAVFVCKWLNQLFFVSIFKCVTVMTFYAQICTKKSSKWSKYSKLCVVGIQIRKYILRWTCVYRINFKIRNSKIQANYTAKVKVVRESPNSGLPDPVVIPD